MTWRLPATARGRARKTYAGAVWLTASINLISGCSNQLGTHGGRASAGSGEPMGRGLGGAPGSGSTLPTGGSAPTSTMPGTVPSETLAFSCDPAAKAPVAILRRLTLTQYRNTLRDLVTATLDAAQADAVMQSIAPLLALVPRDQREPVPQDLHGSYRRLDQSVQQSHVDGFYDVGVALGAALTTPERLGASVGACATDSDASNDATCLDAFIRSFGEAAARRPLREDEVSFYKSVYGTSTPANSTAYADVVGVLLNAPDFLYLVEHGGPQVESQVGAFEVTATELASRLSYQLWQTAPDAELKAAATAGTLLDAGAYEGQVARLLSSPRARPTLAEFWEDWMKVADLPALDAKIADPVFLAFSASDLPGPALKQDMTDDVMGLVNYYSWTQPAGVAALLSTELSFARTPALAKIYGVPMWDGVRLPTSFPSQQRPGLLTRALFLSTGSANTRPVMKGISIRHNVLCDSIPPPPPGANAQPPELEPGLTTRETVSKITEQPGTVCTACHAGIINPLGFATENFDSLGRFRTEQQLFDARGNSTGKKAVDTRVVPQVVLGDMRAIATPAELMALMQESTKVEACLARNFFRFTYARWEDPSLDGCALEATRKALVAGTVQDLLRATTLTTTFKRRTFE